MAENETIYPEMLYKMRRGIAPYKHIEGDIYEDTTCSHSGEHCRISVKMVGDHYEFNGCINDSAKEHESFHKRFGYDTHYYVCKKFALKAWYENRIDRYYKWIEDYKKSVSEAETEMRKMSPKELRPQSIYRVDYDYKIVLANVGLNGDITTIAKEVVVSNKMFNKDGLVYIGNIEEDVEIYDTSHKEFMNAVLKHTDYEGDLSDDNYAAFMSREDYDAYKYNEKYRNLNRIVDGYADGLKGYEDDIKRLKDKMRAASIQF